MKWMLRMCRMGSCHASSRGGLVARFHSNPSGKCLAGRSAALRRLPIAGLLAAHRALHPIPARRLCNSKKTLNRLLCTPEVPHGSNQKHLLIARSPYLCQRCHQDARHPGNRYDEYQRQIDALQLVNKGCVNCHVSVHGSNHPSGELLLR